MGIKTRIRKEPTHLGQDAPEVYTTQVKRRPGRPANANKQPAKGKQPLRGRTQLTLQDTYSDLDERRERLLAIRQQLSVGDMFLSGMSIEEISELTALDKEQVLQEIKAVENVMFAKLAVLSERLTYLNVGRLERLMATWMPLAMQADEGATRQVLSIQKSELDWAERISSKQTSGSRDDLYQFENTISTQGNLYLSAATNADPEWLRDAEIAVAELYAEDMPDVDPEGLREDIRKFEQEMHFEPEEAVND